MDYRCFVIMPQGEPSGYSPGHFNRVYDYVIIPACRAAGYWPTRADNASYDNPLSVVKEIIDCEIALCDLSASNANALYGLAIRQGLSLPVAVVKDMKSLVLFDANKLGLLEYDESLRIDTVQKTIESLAEALKRAVETKKERHELLDRLSIGLPPPPVQPSVIDEPTSTMFVEPAIHEEPTKAEPERIPIISPLPDYVGEAFNEQQILKLKTGDELFHLRFGKGKVNFVKKTGKDNLASIQFESGPKLLVLFATDFFRKVK